MTTPSQTVGPFFAVGMPALSEGAGDVWLRGRVLDGAGEPVPDAVVEAWQADPPAFARDRLVATFDLPGSEPEWALAYRWDIVLRATPFEEPS